MTSPLLQKSEHGLQSFDMSESRPDPTPDEMPLTGIVHGVDLAVLGAALDEVRPTLLSDGGDMLFRGVDERGIVSVELIGACGTCPLSAMTLVFGIEQVVLQKVPGVLGVVACSPAIPELSDS
jgi:Fe-S cluster biogenesis protein NfuA